MEYIFSIGPRFSSTEFPAATVGNGFCRIIFFFLFEMERVKFMMRIMCMCMYIVTRRKEVKKSEKYSKINNISAKSEQRTNAETDK